MDVRAKAAQLLQLCSQNDVTPALQVLETLEAEAELASAVNISDVHGAPLVLLFSACLTASQMAQAVAYSCALMCTNVTWD
jgi:hypothetical protein